MCWSAALSRTQVSLLIFEKQACEILFKANAHGLRPGLPWETRRPSGVIRTKRG
jgi:hypothetical protein